MQRNKIKIGEIYAYTHHTRTYGARFPVKVLATDHPFEVPRRRGYGVEPVIEIEKDILLVRVNADGSPFYSEYNGAPAKPFRLSKVQRVLHTWADEEAEREAKKNQAARVAQQHEVQQVAAEFDRGSILQLLGGQAPDFEHSLKGAHVGVSYNSGGKVVLNLPNIDSAMLVRLLKAARTAALLEASED